MVSVLLDKHIKEKPPVHYGQRAFFNRTVIPSGLEPETLALEGRRSIQLSYGT